MGRAMGRVIQNVVTQMDEQLREAGRYVQAVARCQDCQKFAGTRLVSVPSCSPEQANNRSERESC